MKEESQNSKKATYINNLALILQKQILLKEFMAFNAIRLMDLSYSAKADLMMNENQKALICNLLNTVHNEPKFFESLNQTIAALTNYRNAEVLLLDKVHRTAFGYPNLSCYVRSNADASQELRISRTLSFNTDDLNMLDDVNGYHEGMGQSSESANSRKFEFSYEEESILKYVIHSREVVNSANLPQISLYNRNVDIPLALKFGHLANGDIHRKSIAQFLYFPICNSSKTVIGVVRIFFDRDETMDLGAIDKLSK